MEKKKYSGRRIRHLLSYPFLYMLIIPLIITDILIEIYHRICFPLYKIPLVKRSNYIKIDKHKLKYLRITEKIGCVYCGYANGWANYSSKIAGETEKYWCGIKHKKYKGFVEPKHHKSFVKYGDEREFKKRYK